jgi:hypothetical protein
MTTLDTLAKLAATAPLVSSIAARPTGTRDFQLFHRDTGISVVAVPLARRSP